MLSTPDNEWDNEWYANALDNEGADLTRMRIQEEKPIDDVDGKINLYLNKLVGTPSRDGEVTNVSYTVDAMQWAVCMSDIVDQEIQLKLHTKIELQYKGSAQLYLVDGAS